LDLREGKWQEAVEDCIKKTHNLYSSPDIIRGTKCRRMKQARHVPIMGEIRNAHKNLVEKPEWKKPLRRPGSICVENFKMVLRETGCDYLY
jgi:hypothetical protein